MIVHKTIRVAVVLVLAVAEPSTVAQVAAQGKKLHTRSPGRFTVPDTSAFQSLEWRNVGPFRGGRASTVAGIPGNPQEYYMGTNGGGLWKTTDGGTTWINVSDRYIDRGSIGYVAVAPNDSNIVYVGTGESVPRGQMSSFGDGVYKSIDGGKSWNNIGLENTRQISKILIHPRDNAIVYVAALGSRWQPSDDRGIYRSKDGGASWQRILFVDRGAGAIDLTMAPNDPNVMYAAFWDFQRLPWYLRSGGSHSGIWKSTDGGETWKQLSGGGLPSGIVGRIGIAVSPANANRIYAIVEADSGGVFRSDDAGRTWQLMDGERAMLTRPWYYSSLTADPKSPDVVYVNTWALLRSVDGGTSFTSLASIPHGDTHDSWINPNDPRNMINANDGGAAITFNGGRTWTKEDNQPTGQFYRVQLDEVFPYTLYAGQQDATSVVIPSRFLGVGLGHADAIGRADWRTYGGCETATFAFDPKNPRYTYETCYLGQIDEFDALTGRRRVVRAWPMQGFAEPSNVMKYRFNWSAPLATSPFDGHVIYHGGNVLFRSSDRGNSWTAISPDLTRNDKAHQGQASGPFWNDGSGGEVYNTIYEIVESPHERGTIWVGTDDGLVQLTRDGGRTWTNVTPRGVQEGLVHSIEVSPHDAATAYVAFTRFKFDDNTPHLFKTADYGKTWTDLATGLPRTLPAYVVREDPDRRGLLYAGTETSVWVSFDSGSTWRSLQRNLPHVTVSDLKVQDGDLVASTEGRALWILDDITSLHALSDSLVAASASVVKPRRAYRILGGAGGDRPGDAEGKNAPFGARIRYWVGSHLDSSQVLSLEIIDSTGTVVRSFSSAEGAGPGARDRLSPQRGMNQLIWNLRAAGPVSPSGKGGSRSGPAPNGYVVPSGTYRVRLTLGRTTSVQSFDLVNDPRYPLSPAAEREQVATARVIVERIAAIDRNVVAVRNVRDQARQHPSAAAGNAALRSALESLVARADSIVSRLTETKGHNGPAGSQDGINFRQGLDAQFSYLQGVVEGSYGPVTQGVKDRLADLESQWADWRRQIGVVLSHDLTAVNGMLTRASMKPIVPPDQ